MDRKLYHTDRPISSSRNPVAVGVLLLGLALGGVGCAGSRSEPAQPPPELSANQAAMLKELRAMHAELRGALQRQRLSFSKGQKAALYRMQLVELNRIIARLERGEKLKVSDIDRLIQIYQDFNRDYLNPSANP